MTDHRLAAALGRCRGREDDMLAVLERLVVENSHTGNRAGGTRVAELLAESFGAVPGLEVRLESSERFAPHVVVSSASSPSSSGCIALVGHHDTVFPPGTFEGFRTDGGLVRGPGVLDMKGGLVVVLFALRSLAETGLLASLPLRLVIVSDEEVGSPEGAGVLARELAGAACALTFESGRAKDAVITARKGTGSLRLVAHGKAAHSGNHHADGANAIWALARAIDAAQGVTDYARGITINTGTVTGGLGRNTVPEHAEALVDLRYVARADGEAALERLRARCAEAAAGLAGTRVEVVGGLARPPLERSDANVALYREYAACARDSGLGDGEAPLVGGGSDAATTAALGIASIDGLGPRGRGFHTTDEQFELASLVPKTEALVRFLARRAEGVG
jgi:glutamate carboxypeptidase